MNNSVFSSKDRSPFRATANDPGFVCRNNIFYSTAGDTKPACTGTGAISNNASLNVSDAVRLTANPFVGTSPKVTSPIAEWELNNVAGGGLELIDAAMPLAEVKTDFLLRRRPIGAAPEIGALEAQTAPAAIPPLPPYLLPAK